MSPILYEIRCKCKEEFSIIKKQKSSKKRRKLSKQSKGTTFLYPNSKDGSSKTFQIKYEGRLSSVAKFLLKNFQKKYFYYAIDDILYLLKSNAIERDNLLEILYSPIISLQNNFSINFFDIWIDTIYINEVPKKNKFLKENYQIFESFNYITIKLLYRTRIPIKKQESLW